MDALNTKIKNIKLEKALKVLPENIKSGETIFGIAGSVIELHGETKSVTPSTSAQTITPSSGKNGITQVNVSAVDNTIDNNIQSGNIKDGVTILGVTGNYSGTAPSGTISITQNGTVDVTNYATANVSVAGENNAKLATPSSYNSKGIIEFFTKIDGFSLSGIGTDASSFFLNGHELTEIKFNSIDSTITNFSNFFQNCSSLTKIEGLDISHATNLKQTFRNCSSLVNLPSLTAPSATNLQNIFVYCTALSNDSLNNVLALCASATGSTTKTLAYIGLTPEQATTCTGLSNWTAAQSAGWTKGY